MPESSSTNALTEAVFYIMLSLTEPLHGYGVAQKAKGLSGGRINLGPGTLYGAIETLAKKGWIAEAPGEKDSRGKKEYQLTEVGQKKLRAELDRLRELVQNGERVLGKNE